MIIGSYSVFHAKRVYDDSDPDRKIYVREYMILFMFALIIWFVALSLLVYYWNTLELWARVIGVLGLLFNSGGSLITILVVLVGVNKDKLLSEEYSTSPKLTITRNDSSVNMLPGESVTPEMLKNENM